MDIPAGRYDMIGTSEPMHKVYLLIEQITLLPEKYKMPIILSGERGTGKELVAKAIHNYGPRKTGSFVAFNCTAVTETIAEAELFGYKKGSFTGAHKDRIGLFQESNEGTLYIDEIVNMPLSMQSKLLRAIQERKVRPVGSQQEQEYDTQIVVSSNKSLEEAMKKGEFMPDLYDRLNVVQINIPALRERKEDIVLLAKYFTKKYGGMLGKDNFNFTAQATQALKSYSWPGNVRQLEATIQGIIGLRRDEESKIIGQSHLEERLGEVSQSILGTSLLKGSHEHISQIPHGTTMYDYLRIVEQDICTRVLQENKGNRAQTARQLGMERTTLILKLKKWGVK